MCKISEKCVREDWDIAVLAFVAVTDVALLLHVKNKK